MSSDAWGYGQNYGRNYRLIHGLCEAQNWRCAYCGVVMQAPHETPLDDLHWSVDHYVPRAHGGTSHWENLFAACRRCNQARAHFDPLLFYGIVVKYGVAYAERSIAKLKSRHDRQPPASSVLAGKIEAAIAAANNVTVNSNWPQLDAERAAEQRINRRAGDAPRSVSADGYTKRAEQQTTLADIWPKRRDG